MAEIDVLNEDGQTIGRAPYEVVHSDSLLHRSVGILVFDKPDLETLLICERSHLQAVSPLKLHSSAAGHTKLGQSYLDAALDELREELFYGMEQLPSGITLVHTVTFRNESRPTNREIVQLFHAVYPGPFSPDYQEVERLFWQDCHETWQDMQKNPNRYAFTFRKVLAEFRKYRGE